jgi:hypothetical protein
VPTLNEFQFHNKILTKNIQTDGAKEKRNVKGKMSSRSIPKSLSRFEIDGTKEKPFINPSKKTIYQEKLADVLEFEKLVSRNTKITKISQTNA